MSKYEHLLSPLKVGNTILKNRIASGPTVPLALCDEHPRPTDRFIDMFVAKARGGAGIVTVGGIDFQPLERVADMAHYTGMMDLYKVENQRAIARMIDQIHSYGALVSFNAALLPTYGYAVSGGKVYGAASVMDIETKGEMPEEVMFQIAEDYANAAVILKELGADIMLIFHSQNIDEFLSPIKNKRTDKYGGSLENRARFPIMIIDRIREKVGYDFLLDLKPTGLMSKYGYQMDDFIGFLKMVEGKIDIVNMFAGGLPESVKENLYMGMPSDYGPDKSLVKYARQIKDSGVDMIVGVGGGLQQPHELEEVIADGDADLVYMARGLIADPEIGNKLYANRPEDVIPCIKCYHCVDTSVRLACSVNPLSGREIDFLQMPKTDAPKKVAVIGGGPAGMEAAITAAQVGHQVTLFEREDHLGGRIVFSDKMQFKRGLKRFKDYLISHVEKSGAEIRLGEEATVETLREGGFEHVIVAVGAEHKALNIDGLMERAIQVGDLYEKDAEVTGDVVVIGGGMSGCETAYYLAQKGHKVSIIEYEDSLCPGAMELGTKTFEYTRMMLTNHLYLEKNIVPITSAKCVKVTDDAVYYEQDGEQKSVPANTVILAAGMLPRRDEAFALWQNAIPTSLVGDCMYATDIEYATHSAFEAAITIK